MDPEDKASERTNQVFKDTNNEQKKMLTRRRIQGYIFAYDLEDEAISQLPDQNPQNLIIKAQKHKRLHNGQYAWITKYELVFKGFLTEDDPADNKCKFFEYKHGYTHGITAEKDYTYAIAESDCTINVFDNGEKITALRFLEKNFEEDILSWEQRKQDVILAQRSQMAAMQKIEEMDTSAFRVLLRM